MTCSRTGGSEDRDFDYRTSNVLRLHSVTLVYDCNDGIALTPWKTDHGAMEVFVDSIALQCSSLVPVPL